MRSCRSGQPLAESVEFLLQHSADFSKGLPGAVESFAIFLGVLGDRSELGANLGKLPGQASEFRVLGIGESFLDILGFNVDGAFQPGFEFRQCPAQFLQNLRACGGLAIVAAGDSNARNVRDNEDGARPKLRKDFELWIGVEQCRACLLGLCRGCRSADPVDDMKPTGDTRSANLSAE